MGKFCTRCGWDLSRGFVHLCPGLTPAQDDRRRAVYCDICGERQSRCRWCNAVLDCDHGKLDPLVLLHVCSSFGS